MSWLKSFETWRSKTIATPWRRLSGRLASWMTRFAVPCGSNGTRTATQLHLEPGLRARRGRPILLLERARARRQGGETAEAGFLASYWPNSEDLNLRAATYVDRILKGARPGDIPIEEPTRRRTLTDGLSVAGAIAKQGVEPLHARSARLQARASDQPRRRRPCGEQAYEADEHGPRGDRRRQGRVPRQGRRRNGQSLSLPIAEGLVNVHELRQLIATGLAELAFLLVGV